jgi:hypothetical protein
MNRRTPKNREKLPAPGKPIQRAEFGRVWPGLPRFLTALRAPVKIGALPAIEIPASYPLRGIGRRL